MLRQIFSKVFHYEHGMRCLVLFLLVIGMKSKGPSSSWFPVGERSIGSSHWINFVLEGVTFGLIRNLLSNNICLV